MSGKQHTQDVYGANMSRDKARQVIGNIRHHAVSGPVARLGRKTLAKANRKWVTPLSHPGYTLVADICPSCSFPEADGGYCPECGWELPVRTLAAY